MDRLQQIALARRAADPGSDRLTLRLFAGFALLLVGVAAAGMAVFALALFPAPTAGLVLGVAGIVGGPVFWLGRRHARRR